MPMCDSAFHEADICRNILENLPVGLCVIDLQRRIIFWSHGAERITGHLRHEVVGHSCIDERLLHCDHPGCEFCSEDCPIARAIKTSHPSESAGLLRHKAGHEIPVHLRAVPVHNQRGSIIGAVETFEEIQQNARDRDPRRPLPHHLDGVTGVAGRTLTHLHLRQALATFRETEHPVALILLRVEALPRFRSSLGPEAASSLLRVVARTIEGALEDADFLGRWSDDHFLVILTGCEPESLTALRERLRHSLAGESIEWWGERHSLPISIGQAAAESGDSVESILDRANKSLAAASAWRTSAAAGSSSSGSQ